MALQPGAPLGPYRNVARLGARGWVTFRDWERSLTRIIAFVACLASWNLAAAQDVVITHARILDGTGTIIDQGSLVIRDERIVSVSAGASEAPGALEIDAQGMTVMPGLVNTHWHLLTGVPPGSSDAAIDKYIEDVVADLLDSLLERGVTTIMSAGDHFPNIVELRRKLTSGEMRGPRLLVVGPVFTAPDDWPTQLCQGNSDCKLTLTAELTTREQARAKVREVGAAGVDAVKLVYDDRIAPDVRVADDVVAAIADEAQRHGLTLFAHISTGEETALRLVELGVRGLVHPVPFRSPASAGGARILRDRHIPVSTTIGGRTREWVELTGRDYSEQDEAVLNQRLEDIKHLWDEGVTVAFGTDSTISQSASAEGRFLAEARALNRVLSNQEVIATLTQNAAAYLGLEDELGTLEAGKIADIAIIDGDPLADISDLRNVEVVIQGGRIVVDKRQD